MAATELHVGLKNPYIAGDPLELYVEVPFNLTGVQSIHWSLYPWPNGPKYGAPETTAALTKTLAAGGITAIPPDGSEPWQFLVRIVTGDTANLSGMAADATTMYGQEAEVVLADGSSATVLSAFVNLFKVTPQRIALQ